MRALVFDTETTGLLNFSLPADDPAQPRMIELGFTRIDLDNTGAIVEGHHFLIKPDGWTMPDELAVKMGHGLTQERLEAEGVPVIEALQVFSALHDECDLLVAYNIPFDQKILRGELRRAGFPDKYGALPSWCAMQAARRHVGGKVMKLSVAVEQILGRKHEGAHTAPGDVKATADLLIKLFNPADVKAAPVPREAATGDAQPQSVAPTSSAIAAGEVEPSTFG